MGLDEKTVVGDLAIFGGGALMDEPLHVGRPNIGSHCDFLGRVEAILKRGWLTNRGQCVQEFEKKVADYLGVKHCIAMCNGTVALEIAIRALGLKGEVIVPSFTFVATAHALQWQEITPVFCDIDPVSGTIDPDQIESMITPRTTGIIGVHLWGRPCATEQIARIAAKHKLEVLYDAAHAFGCSHAGKMIGNFGAAEVLSFHATKFFNTLEGGAVVTNDDALATKVRLMKNFGFSGYDNVIYIGTNGKMNEVSAAMGLTNFAQLEEFIEVNRRNYHAYKNGLADLHGVTLFPYDESEKSNYQYIAIEADERRTGLSRDALIEILHAENVLARRYFFPGCHRMQPYKALFPHAGLLLPNTERLAARVIMLPTGSAVQAQQVEAICELLKYAVRHADDILPRLRHRAAQAGVGAKAGV